MFLKEAFCNAAAIIKTDNLKAYVNYPVSKFLVVGKHEKLIPVQEALLSKSQWSDKCLLFRGLFS